MKFRSGKYKGVSLETVKRINPGYVQWVRENRPEMLKNFNKKNLKQSKFKAYKKPVYTDPPDIPRENALTPKSPSEAF